MVKKTAKGRTKDDNSSDSAYVQPDNSDQDSPKRVLTAA
jgi:hypothetical protein